MLMKDISCSVNSINVKSGHENNKEDGKDKMQTVKVPGKSKKHKVLLIFPILLFSCLDLTLIEFMEHETVH